MKSPLTEASSGSEEEEDDGCDKNAVANNNHRHNQQFDELASWQAEMQQRLQQESDFLRELRARKDGSGSRGRSHSSRGTSDSEQDK